MTLNLESVPQDRVAADRYQSLADDVLSGNPIGRDDALSIFIIILKLHIMTTWLSILYQ